MLGNTVALPDSSRVDVGILARLLDDRATSYKFFFFLALLGRIGRSALDGADALDRPVPLKDLAVDMMLAGGYPHGFCRLSLGSRDKLQDAIDAVEWGDIRGAYIVAGQKEWRRLRTICEGNSDTESLLRFVPFRLIRPFFEKETRGLPDHRVNATVARLADELFLTRNPLYCFTDDRSGIVLHHDWIEYLGRNLAIVKGWTHFSLAEYLQSRNPSIPGIIEKIEPPLVRDALGAQTRWWRKALPKLGGAARCIYSGAPLTADTFSLDHYLPWSFVAHDRLWNLVPVSKAVNSAKSDRLPSTEYLEPMVELQYQALKTMRATVSYEKWLTDVEPWLSDLRIEHEEALLDRGTLLRAYEATMLSLGIIAESQGFKPDWVYETA